MVRTQIQLSDQQMVFLKAAAAQTGASMAEVIRQSVDFYLRHTAFPATDTRRERALEAVGAFSSDASDTSADHDRYLADAFLER